MALIDDVNTALAALNTAIATEVARRQAAEAQLAAVVQAPDLTPVVTEINAATTALTAA